MSVFFVKHDVHAVVDVLGSTRLLKSAFNPLLRQAPALSFVS